MRGTLLASASLAAIAVGLCATTARAQDHYVSLFGGGVLPENSGFIYNSYMYDVRNSTGFTLGMALGGYITPTLRKEIEFSYMRYSGRDYTYYGGQASPGETSGDQNLYFLMGNIWKDFPMGGGITPYVGIGLGLGVADVAVDVYTQDGTNILDTSIGIAAQLGAGLRFPLSDRLQAEVGYRFKALLATDPNGAFANDSSHSRVNYYSHSIIGGISYLFGDSSLPPAMGGSGIDYVSLFAGGAFPESIGFVNYGYLYDVRSKTGFTIGAAAGSNLAPGLRGELEFSYTNYAAETYSYGPGNLGPATGDSSLYMLVGNLWRDINLGRFSVYAGGGVGIGLVDAFIEHYSGEGVDDSRIGLAAQVGAGVRVPVSDRMLIDASYRFRGVIGTTLDGANGNGDERGSFFTHVAQLGVIYGLNGGLMDPPPSGLPANSYVSLFAGLVGPENAAFSYDSYVYDTRFKTGFTLGATAGSEILPGLRGELEISYMNYAAADYTYTGADPTDPAIGEQNLYFVMANLWKDIDTGTRFTPYAGGGVGIGIANIDVEFDPPGGRLASTNVGFAAQIGAGVKVQVSDNMAIDVGYRLKGIFDATIYGDPGTSYHGQSNFLSHVGQVGVVWNLN